MKTRIALVLAMALLSTTVAFAQQMQPQPLVYLAEFSTKPGKEEEFMNLVKKYDEPTFNKLMEEGAVIAWGVDITMLHEPGAPTHTFWWVSPNWTAFDKAYAAFEEQERKMKAEDAAVAEEARKKGRPAPKGGEERRLETVDITKHKDYLLRDLIVRFAETPPPADAKPWSSIFVVRAKPGKGDEYRKLWEKYNQPVLDKLLSDGVINGYEFGIEEVKSTDTFTHFSTVVMPNLAARDKVRDAFMADRQARSEVEREHIAHSFQHVLDLSASRQFLMRTILLRVAVPKK